MSEQDVAAKVPANTKTNHLRNLAIWLCLLPVVLLILFISGELSLLGLRTGQVGEMQSKLDARYEHWDYQVLAPMDSVALKSIIKDEGYPQEDDFFVPGNFLPTSASRRTLPKATSTPTPGQVVAVLPSATLTPRPPVSTDPATPTQPASETSTATATATLELPPTPTETAASPGTPTASITPTRPKSQGVVWTATRTRTSTRRPTRTPTRTMTGTLTPVPPSTLTPTGTSTSTRPATSTPSLTVLVPASQTHTPTSPPVSTSTLTPTAPFTPSATAPSPTRTQTNTPAMTPGVPTLTHTPTDTPVTPSITPTFTWTPTDIPPTDTPTYTPEPTQLPLPPGINIGPPDRSYNEVGCGGSITIDLGSQIYIGRLAYYEVEDPANPGHIALDWVLVSVSANSDGPWVLIFYWGDSNSGNNGDVPVVYYPPEIDNQLIGMGELYNGTGIRSLVGGTYRYVLIQAPPGCGDPAQVDAIEVLP